FGCLTYQALLRRNADAHFRRGIVKPKAGAFEQHDFAGVPAGFGPADEVVELPGLLVEPGVDGEADTIAVLAVAVVIEFERHPKWLTWIPHAVGAGEDFFRRWTVNGEQMGCHRDSNDNESDETHLLHGFFSFTVSDMTQGVNDGHLRC